MPAHFRLAFKPMSLLESLTHCARDALGQRVRAITGAQASPEDFATPLGDPGLFGPASVAWQVHAHFTAMMVGGLSSLIIQALHPRALAAVWDHSDFRNKLKNRLGRTAYFVAATTYGGEALALRAIERVNAIHANIRGVDLQGRPYAANEPDLLRWVHLVEVSCFLSAYQHLAKTPLARPACDQYVAEMSQVGHRLGAPHLPLQWDATQAALDAFKSELVFDARAQEILKVIQAYPTDVLDRPFMALLLRSALDVMPAWALDLIGESPACSVQKQVTRFALQVASEPVQWVLDQQGVSAIARARVAGQARAS